MTWVQIISCGIALLCLAGVLAALAKTRHPFLRAGASALCGVGALAAIDLLSGLTGVAIALNYATSFVAIVLGAPGIVMLLLMKLLLII